MTSVSPTIPPTGPGATAAATTASTAATASIDFNSFLKLMIAEMKNQDPSNPADPTQYLTQISQMSGVQQGILTNTKLDSMLTASSLTLAEGAIGKLATSADGSVSGVVQSVALRSDGSAIATLDGGQKLTLDNTVTFSTAPASGTGA